MYFELKNLMADYSAREAHPDLGRAWTWWSNSLTLVIVQCSPPVALPLAWDCPSPWPGTVALICLGTAAADAAAPMVVSWCVAHPGGAPGGQLRHLAPAREMLFTAVDRETRFKAKPVIDIVVYRGGDMLNAWAFTALTQGLGLGIAATAGCRRRHSRCLGRNVGIASAASFRTWGGEKDRSRRQLTQGLILTSQIEPLVQFRNGLS